MKTQSLFKGRIVTFLVLLVIFQTRAEPNQSHRNVLFLCIDDLNDWVGCMGGHPQSKTPHIDALASRGTLFTNTHCQSPICGPSRASFLSGRFAHETGIYNQPRSKKVKMIDDTTNFHGHLLTEYFGKHGYDTIGAGKITHGYPLKKAVKTAGPDGGSGPKPVGPKPPNDVRFNYTPDYSQPFTGTQTDWGAFPDRDSEMPDFQTADWIIEQIEKERSTPFFIAAGFNRPHVPFYAPQKWFDLHPLNDVILPKIDDNDLDDVPEIGVQLHQLPRYPQLPWLRESDNEQLRRCTQAYLACTTFVDDQVGRVLNALAASSHADNTVIVLFSDHGYHLGEKSRVSKHSLWEESTRVPLIVVRPGDNTPQTCSQPVGLIDLYPTLLELCALPPRPENSGKSLVPLVENPNEKPQGWRHSILTTYARGNHSLRSDRYRYICYDDGSEELYDHQNDPQEWKNLLAIDSMGYAELVETFRSNLPSGEVEYHPAVGNGLVNQWFGDHYRKEGLLK